MAHSLWHLVLGYIQGFLPISMSSERRPHSQSLRAIGQSLEVLGIHSFHLAKRDEDYLVRAAAAEATRASALEKGFLKTIAEIFWRPPVSEKKTAEIQRFNYTPADIESLDAKGRSNRGRANAVPDAYKLSQALRVIGDHLDWKRARACTVSLTRQFAVVAYETIDGDQHQMTLTVQDLYDLAVHMYLRRSNRPFA